MNRNLALAFIAYVLVLGTPSFAQAADIGVFSPNFTVVPNAHALDSSCPENSPLSTHAVLQLMQNFMNLGISLAILFMTLFLIWAGFSFIMSAANAEARSNARKMLFNAVIGMIIVLSAWLIVDFVIKTVAGGDTKFGPWNTILLFDGDACIRVKSVTKIDGLPGVFDTIVNDAGQGSGAASRGGGTAVSSASAQEAARQLLSNANVSSTNSVSSCGTYAGATSNLQQAAAGNGMSRCPCGGGGSVAPDPTLLNSMIDMANAGARFQINVLAGGCHSSGSNHYQGTAADIQRTASLDAFFSKYTRVSCQGSKIGYRVSGEVVCFEDSGHYHVSPTGN